MLSKNCIFICKYQIKLQILKMYSPAVSLNLFIYNWVSCIMRTHLQIYKTIFFLNNLHFLNWAADYIDVELIIILIKVGYATQWPKGLFMYSGPWTKTFLSKVFSLFLFNKLLLYTSCYIITAIDHRSHVKVKDQFS